MTVRELIHLLERYEPNFRVQIVLDEGRVYEPTILEQDTTGGVLNIYTD
jgi:hypothetical protein